MLSLHNTVETLKKLAKWSAIGGATIFSLILIFRIGVTLKDIFFPKPPEPPTVTFGKLPKIPFGESAIQDSLTYTIDTVSGEMPIFSDRAKVFKVEQPNITLLNANKAKTKAEGLDFVDQTGIILPHKSLSPTEYQWEKDSFGLRRFLKINIETFAIDFTTNYMTQASIMNPAFVSDEKETVNVARQFMEFSEVTTEDLDLEKTKSQLFTITNGTLIPAASLSTAHVNRISFYQKDLEKMPIFYPRHPVSTINFIVSLKAIDVKDVLEAHIHFQKILEESATYPIKTATEALKELEDGKGYIANYYGSGTDIKITDVLLGYYIGETPQEYLMPVVVFQGDGEFTAYVSAVKEDWLK